MVNITLLPSKEIHQFAKGTLAFSILPLLSPETKKSTLAISINGKLADLSTALTDDIVVEPVTWENSEGKKILWHSTAHLLAEAVLSMYPNVKFWVGPPIEQGFYYDMDFGTDKLTDEALLAIEKKMYELARQNNKFIREEISKEDAIKYFEKNGNHYKLDILSNLTDGEITFYKQGTFVDLCAGPHIPNTSFIKALKLTNIAGAYWKGDSNNKQLTRIYGISFPDKSLLESYLINLEESKKRDHRKLGKELGIYMMDEEIGMGLPLWLPNGAIVIEELEKLAKETEKEYGYHRVVTPHIAKESLYQTSGHLPYYADSMFPPMELEGEKYYLKAMNCPHHHKIFANDQKSYRDLPYRIAEYGTCYRYEQSGELLGLMRVRCLHMNDAHIYCSVDQFFDEFKSVNEMYLRYFKIFGIEKYVMRLSLHDPSKLGQKYVDNKKLWFETEQMVREVLIATNTPFVEVKDEAAFYGPKIDVQIWSIIGKEFTLATNQVDFNSGIKFKLSFTNKANTSETPIIIHRAPLGTHERFIGFLLEHYAGKFPLWLAPIQVSILPISDKVLGYAQKVSRFLTDKGIRADLDQRQEKIGRKIRDSETKKIPYMVILGEKEALNELLSYRKHGHQESFEISCSSFSDKLLEEINGRV